MTISVKINGTGTSYQLPNCPYMINAIYSSIDPSKTTIGTGATLYATAGIMNSTLIYTKDGSGNTLTYGGNILSASGYSSSKTLGTESL